MRHSSGSLAPEQIGTESKREGGACCDPGPFHKLRGNITAQWEGIQGEGAGCIEGAKREPEALVRSKQKQ